MSRRDYLLTRVIKTEYHGTTNERWKTIRRQGIAPALPNRESGFGAFTTPDFMMGHMYADRATRKAGGRTSRRGKLIALSDSPVPMKNNDLNATGRLREYRYEEGIPKSRITHAQNVNPTSDIRWNRRVRGTKLTSPLDDPKIMASIHRSQARKAAMRLARRAA